MQFLPNKNLCGIDEAGCGSLFGPVVACAVIMPEDKKALFENIKDSKSLGKSKRNMWYEKLVQNCIYSIGIASNIEIDEINIRQATILACKRASNNLKYLPHRFYVDGNMVFKSEKYISIVKGDNKFIEIASASIIAKVTRDHFCYLYDKLYPEYNLNQNKGYPTSFHRNKIKSKGPSNMHRKTFVTRLM